MVSPGYPHDISIIISCLAVLNFLVDILTLSLTYLLTLAIPRGAFAPKNDMSEQYVLYNPASCTTHNDHMPPIWKTAQASSIQDYS